MHEHLKRVSVRLVNDGSLLSDQPLTSPEQAVAVMGDYLSSWYPVLTESDSRMDDYA